jgi:hypothetical protein
MGTGRFGMRIARLLLPLTLLVVGLAVATPTAKAAGSNLVITAVTADTGAGSTAEWYEIANVSGHAITDTVRIQGYTGTSCSTLSIDVEFNFDDATIAKGDHIVFGTSSSGVAYDYQMFGGDAIQSTGMLRVTSNGLANYEDRVAWGTTNSGCPEGSPASALAADRSIVRANRSTCPSDTDNNATDFTLTNPDTSVVSSNNGCDTDGDEVADARDNCQAIANADQANNDGDGLGDVCDDDDDNDGSLDVNDNCPVDANGDQADLDIDDIGDVCDDDDDDDAVLDVDDACPRLLGSPGPGGCPDLSPSITVKYQKSAGGFTGFINGPAACVSDETVELYKKTRAGRKFLASTLSNSVGAYVIPRTKRPGVYFAVAPQNIEPDSGRCLAAEAKTRIR